MAKDDTSLVERSKAGDREAFGELVERYGRMISVLVFQKVGRRDEAEDIVQDVFFRAFGAIGSLRDPTRFAGWLYRLAFRRCIDWQRC